MEPIYPIFPLYFDVLWWLSMVFLGLGLIGAPLGNLFGADPHFGAGLVCAFGAIIVAWFTWLGFFSEPVDRAAQDA